MVASVLTAAAAPWRRTAPITDWTVEVVFDEEYAGSRVVDAWLLDAFGASELGETTRLGF